MTDAQSQVDTVRVPLGTPDGMLVGGGGRQVLVLADPFCPPEVVEALEMAGHALAAGVRVESYVQRHDPYASLPPGAIPVQLPAVQRQTFGLPYGAHTTS